MKNVTIKTKLISLVIISILVVSIIVLIESSTALYNASTEITKKFENDAYSSKEDELKSNVQIAYKTVESFYEQALKDPDNVQKYKDNAIKTLKNIRYGKDGYFWINDSHPRMIMHPIEKSFVGKDMSTYQDSKGKYLFNEVVKVSKNNKQGGLVKYNSLKPGVEGEYPKFSYVIRFEPWDWIIGTGAYVDNISDSINKMENITRNRVLNTISINILTILLTVFILFIVVIIIAKKSIFKPLSEFQTGLLDFFKYVNGEKKEVTRLNNNSDDEIGLMSKAVNAGILKVEETITQKAIEEWIKDGVSELNQILINEKDVQNVCDKSIDFICSHLNAGVGVVYLLDDDILSQYASYAHVIRNELSNKFKLKEGIVGQVAFQKKPILLKNIKKDEALITTGTLTQSSFNTYTFPLIYNEELYGVVEIGSFNEFKEKDLAYLDATKRIICLALLNAFQDKKVKELLENTKEANKQLEENQLKLEEANAYMEEQQQQLEEANANLEEQQQQLEEANANMEEQQQQLIISEQNLKLQNQKLEDTKQEITKKAEELEKTGKYKSEFLANMSHELRTPLNSIILLSSLFQKNSHKNLTNDDIKKAKTIFDSGNDLLRLINDILDLSKVESGKMEIIVDNFSSSNLLNQMKDMFQYTAIDKGLTFKIIDDYNGNISTDKDRISQIIKNLISNSFKFTKEGSITLKISKSDDLDFKISVIDTGIGIPEKKQKLIFKAFTQADGSTSREYGGTGLGLSITKELAKLLGGYVKLTSKENEGSTFSIILPNLEKEDNKDLEIKQIEAKEENPIPSIPEIPIVENVKDDREIIQNKDEAYLIIDDDKMFTEIVYDEIKKDGSFALIALTAISGFELIKKYNIKGILLDLTLPDIDGIDVLRELKSNPETRQIPVHIISSKDKNNETLELGAIGYHQKPVYDGDIDNILAAINKFAQKEIKDLLIVEDKPTHKESLLKQVGEDVNIISVNSVERAIKEIKKETFDTVIVDFALENTYEVCEFIKNNYSTLPIIIYTDHDLSKEDKIKLQEYSNSIIMKTANSNERILSEINLFLHRDKQDHEEENSKEIFETINLEGTNILIVDDDIKNIFVLDAALKEFNATTYTTFNGKEALEFLEDNKNIDLILMDIMMPIMNGYEAMEKIRENEKLRHIPIIAVTAKAMKEDREKCIKLGADDYMSKPIDINILGNLINIWSKKKHK